MPTFRTRPLAIVREAAAVAAVLCAFVFFLTPDPALPTWDVHPAWLGVLILAARYGTAGLLAGGLAVWGGTALLGQLAGDGALSVAQRLSGAGDLVALGGATVVAWVSSLRDARRVALEEQVTELEEKLANTEVDLGALQASVSALRARADRIDSSMIFWKDIARRLEAGTAEEAASAAAELARIRTGARVALVRRVRPHGLTTVAWSGTWSPSSAKPPQVLADRTAEAAIERRRLVLVNELHDARLDDADVAMPVVDTNENVVAVLALRGLTYARFGQAERTDLGLIATWLAPRLGPLPVERIASPVDPHTPEDSNRSSVLWG